jgi:hypothetical protein
MLSTLNNEVVIDTVVEIYDQAASLYISVVAAGYVDGPCVGREHIR